MMNSKDILIRLVRYFEEEKRRNGFIIPVENVLERACVASGVSIGILRLLQFENNGYKEPPSSSDSNHYNEPESTTPGYDTPNEVDPEQHQLPPKRKILITNHFLNSLRTVIENYERVTYEKPTLKKILALARRELKFKGRMETLRKILITKLGYTLCRVNHKDIIETEN